MIFDRYFVSLTSWLEWSSAVVDIWLGKKPLNVRPAQAKDAADCARIHAESFAHPWSALTIEQMLAERGVHAHVAETDRLTGFIIVRAVGDEAEVLSIAVQSTTRKMGLGTKLLDASLDELSRKRIKTVFLEVEDGNDAAIALYRRFGFVEVGRRKGYYRNKDGARDALTMRADLSKRSIKPPVLDV